MNLYFTDFIPINKYIIISNGTESIILAGKGTSKERTREILNEQKAPITDIKRDLTVWLL